MDELSYRFATKEYVQARIAEAMNMAGGAILIDKTITANGTYNASDDSADGFKKVIANIPVPDFPPYKIISGSITPVSDSNSLSITVNDVNSVVQIIVLKDGFQPSDATGTTNTIFSAIYLTPAVLFGTSAPQQKYASMTNGSGTFDFWASSTSFSFSSQTATFSISTGEKWKAGTKYNYVIMGV